MGVQVPPFAKTSSDPDQGAKENEPKRDRAMYCFATCTAQSYEIKSLFEHLHKKYQATLLFDAIHIRYKEGDLFFFSYGVIVFWGIQKEDEIGFLTEVEPFEVRPNEEIETDKFNYTVSDDVKLHQEQILLPNREVLTLLSVSHGLAQSVKLDTFDLIVRHSVQLMGEFPEALARKGKIGLSRKEIRKKMGQLFLDRSLINLHQDVLDVPEFFSEHPELEPIYDKTVNYLDLKQRQEVLNQRLDVVHRFFELLTSELNHQHSSRLEWIIIILILLEVVLIVMHDVLKIL